jgi:hypothetical protein
MVLRFNQTEIKADLFSKVTWFTELTCSFIEITIIKYYFKDFNLIILSISSTYISFVVLIQTVRILEINQFWFINKATKAQKVLFFFIWGHIADK